MRYNAGPANRAPDARPDIDDAFYEAFLGPSMAFTCAYFPHEEAGLEEAQQAQFHLIGRKLRLKPYQTLLDIGCGWGSFVVHACKHFGVTAHGVTTSPRQAEYAQAWLKREGLEDQAFIECRDYRELVGELQFDRVSALGVMEHLGLRNLAQFFTSSHRLLKDNGLMLTQGISRDRRSAMDIGSDDLSRQILQGMEPPSLTATVTQLEDNGFELQDVENLRRHYAQTCARWVAGLQDHQAQCLQHVDEATYRSWLLNLGMSSVYFEEGALSFHQLLSSKRTNGSAPLPLTREDIHG